MSYSTFWEPPTRNFRERETAWINSSYYSHDSFCGCGNFAVHLLCVVHSFTRNSTPEAIALELKKQLQPKPLPWYWRKPAYRRRFTRAWRKPRRRARRPRTRRFRQTFRRHRKYYYSTKRRKPRRVRKRLRKKKTINLVQWQPENIVKCKIIGYQALIQCGNGKQCYNYQQHVNDLCLKK